MGGGVGKGVKQGVLWGVGGSREIPGSLMGGGAPKCRHASNVGK